MPKEGELRIKSKRKEKFIHVEFTDTGKGIPKKEKSLILFLPVKPKE
jgi:signal transduction histidine kinase